MTKARAPQTAHLRKIIRKATRQSRHNRQPERRTPLQNIHDERPPDPFRDTRTHHWHWLKPSEEAAKHIADTSCLRAPPHISDGGGRSVDMGSITEAVDIEPLCKILTSLASQFRQEGRLYSAFAATAAVALVQTGRQDDINPGLWRHIAYAETATKPTCERP